MLVNIGLLILGMWGLQYTWKARRKAGSSLYMDLASPTRNPIAYRFAVGIRLLIFGLCAGVGAYRIVFGITT